MKGTLTMTDKKIMAVIGATGAQGGGLVRAILADRTARSRCGRSPASPRRQGPGAGGHGSRGGGRRRRRSGQPRRRPSPAPTARSVSRTSGSTSRPSASSRRRRRWRGRPAGRSGARRLVDARGYAAVDAARRRPRCRRCRAVQGAALRRQGRGRRDLRRRGGADDLPVIRVLLGELHLLRHGPTHGRRTGT